MPSRKARRKQASSLFTVGLLRQSPLRRVFLDYDTPNIRNSSMAKK
jgi:hypothetical protein